MGAVNLFGGLERQINVKLDPARLAGYGLVFDEVAAALAQENVTLPAGNVKVGRIDYTIRVPGEFATAEEIGDIVVRSAGGALVHLRDVAEVEDGFAEERRLSNVMGRRAIMMMIQKRSGANTVETAREVTRELERNIQPTLPRDIEIHQIFDTSEQITQSIANVAHDGAVGVRVRGADGVLLPAQRALVADHRADDSVLADHRVHLHVDDGLDDQHHLDGEPGDRDGDGGGQRGGGAGEHRDEGGEGDGAARGGDVRQRGGGDGDQRVDADDDRGVRAADFPEGRGGDHVQAAGRAADGDAAGEPGVRAVADADAGLPAAAGAGEAPAARPVRGGVPRLERARFAALDGAYSGLLRRALRRRWVVVAAAVAVFAGSVVLFRGLGSEYAPEDDTGRLMLRLQTPIGTRVEETAAAVPADARGGAGGGRAGKRDGLRLALRRVGRHGRSGGSHIGRVMMRLVSQTQRDRGLKEIGRAVADVVSKWPEVQKFNVDTSQMGPGGGQKPIVIEVLGFDLDILQGIAEQVLEVVNTTPGAVDAEIGRDPGRPEIRVEIDRTKAAAHGLNVSQVANGMRTLFYGTTATLFRESDEDYDIVLRLDEPYRRTLADIAQSEIALPDGEADPARQRGDRRGTPGRAADRPAEPGADDPGDGRRVRAQQRRGGARPAPPPRGGGAAAVGHRHPFRRDGGGPGGIVPPDGPDAGAGHLAGLHGDGGAVREPAGSVPSNHLS